MTSCIFCGKTFTPTGEGEHIIPDSIGGSLTIADVCNDCNATMNTLYDNPFVNEDLVRLACESLEIEGRRKNLKNSFLHKVGHSEIGRVKLNDEYKPELISSLNIVDFEDGKFALNATIDKSNVEDIVKFVKRNFPRKLTCLYPDDDERKISIRIEKIISDLKKYCNNPENTEEIRPTIRHRIIYNIDVYKKEICKIAFEFAYHEMGVAYLTDNCAVNLKKCLNSNSGFKNVQGSFPATIGFEPEHDKHYLYISGGACYVSLFGLQSIVKVLDDHKIAPLAEDAHIYIFDPKNKKYSTVKFVEFLASLLHK